MQKRKTSIISHLRCWIGFTLHPPASRLQTKAALIDVRRHRQRTPTAGYVVGYKLEYKSECRRPLSTYKDAV